MSEAAMSEIDKRIKDLAEWVRENATYCFADQKHLDANTP
jgi:hypothetical protein